MAGDLILKRLADKDLTNIAEDVQGYLNPVKTQDLGVPVKCKYGVFSANFLLGSIKCLEGCDAGLISAIHTAYQSFQYTRSVVQLSKPLFIVQCLYHIFMKLSGMDDIDECVKVAHYILDELGDAGDADKVVNNIITSVYHTLWNAAIKFEYHPDCADSALKARHVALKFIALQKRTKDMFIPKVLISLVRYGQVISKSKSYNAGQVSVALLTTVCDDLCNLVTDQYPEASLGVVLIRLLQFKELWGRGHVTQAGEVVDSLVHLLASSKTDLSHASIAINLCKACLRLSYLKQDLCEKTVKDESFKKVSACLSEVSQKYENVSTKSSEGELCTDLKAMVVLLATNFTAEAKSLLNSACQSSDAGLDILYTIVTLLKCQTKFQLEYCDSDLSKVQKSWAWNLQTGKTISTMYLLQLQCLHIVLQKRYTKGQSLLSEALGVINELENHLKRMSANGKLDKVALLEKHCLGTMAQKLGNVCYLNEDDERATWFYKASCKHLTEWCEQDKANRKDKIQEVYLWKCYDSLAECYQRSGQYRQAMTTVIACVMVDRSHLMSAAKLWVRVKKDLLKQGQLSEEILTRSMVESVSKTRVSLQLTEKREMLEQELKVYRSNRAVCRLHEAELKCLHELRPLTSAPVEQAALLVEEAKLLWLHPDLSPARCCLACVEEAVKLLSDQDSQLPLVAATSAEAHLWLYIIRTKQLREQTPVTDVWGSKPYEEPDNGEDKAAMKTKPACTYVTITAENRLTALLDRAVSLWANCVRDNQLSEQLDAPAMTHSLQLCAVIYHSLGKPLKGLQCLQLVKKLSPGCTPESSSLTADCLTRLWSVIDHPSAVSVVLEEWNCPEDLTYCLRTAQHALRLGQLDRCCDQAIDVLEKVQSIQPRTRASCLLEGTALRLLSHLTTVQRDGVVKRLGVRASSSHLAKESVRCLTSLLHHLLGKQLNEPAATKNVQLIDLWVVVIEALLSLLHLGRVNLMTGFARRATCYLEQGLALAQALAIPRWSVCFLTELARLNSIAGCVEDTNLYLRQAREVLSSTEERTCVQVSEGEDQSGNEVQVGTVATTERRSADVHGDCFGFATPQPDEQADFVIHTVPLSMTKGRQLSLDDSLSIELPAPGSSSLLSHPVDCSCLPCADLTSHRLNTAYLLTLTEHYLNNGLPHRAVDNLKTMQQFLEKLTLKMPLFIKLLSHEKAELLCKRSYSGTPMVWLNVLRGKMMCCFAKAYLCQGERTLSLTAAKDGLRWVTEAADSGIADLFHLRAQFQLCTAQAMLTFSQPTPHRSEDTVRPAVSRPSEGQPSKSTAKLKPNSLVKKLENLMLDDDGDDSDEDQYNKSDNKDTRTGSHTSCEIAGQKSKMKNVFKYASDSEDECKDTSSVSFNAFNTGRSKKMSKPTMPKILVEDSDVEEFDVVPMKDIDTDVTEQLSCLSINQGNLKSDKAKVMSTTDHALEDEVILLPEKSTKNSRFRKVENDIHANSSSKRGNLKPKKTRRTAAANSDEASVTANLKPKHTKYKDEAVSGDVCERETLKPKQTRHKTEVAVFSNAVSEILTLKPKQTRRKVATVSDEAVDTVSLKPKKTRLKAEDVLDSMPETVCLKPKQTRQKADPVPDDVLHRTNLKPKQTRRKKNELQSEDVPDTENLMPKQIILNAEPLVDDDCENLKPKLTRRKAEVVSDGLSDRKNLKPKQIRRMAETVSEELFEKVNLKPKQTRRKAETVSGELTEKIILKPKQTRRKAETVSGELTEKIILKPKQTRRKAETVSEELSERENLKPKQTRRKAETVSEELSERENLKPKQTRRKVEAVSDALPERQNLKPKQTTRRTKAVLEVSDNTELKKCPTKRTQSAIPPKVPGCQEQSMFPGQGFMPEDSETLSSVTGKSGTKKQTSKSSKPTRTRSARSGAEIEVQRAMDDGLCVQEWELDLPVLTECDEPDNPGDLARLSLSPGTDPLPMFDLECREQSGDTTSLIKLLNLSDSAVSFDLSLDTSIELVRAGTDDEDGEACRLTQLRKGGRKKSVRDREEKEVTRASRVTSHKQVVTNPKPKLAEKNRPTADYNRCTEASTGKSACVSVPPSGDLIAQLEEALSLILPCPPIFLYRDICQCLALQYLHPSPVRAAHYLAESMAITLRHRARCNTASHHKQLQKAGLCADEVPVDPRLEFGQMDIGAMLGCLPQEWTVCMISVVQSGSGQSELVITRLQNGSDPVVKRVAAFTSHQMQAILSQFTDIMEGSQKVMKISNKTEWWRIRKRLDADLQELLGRLENDCLRGWRSLLVGELAEKSHQDLVTDMLSSMTDDHLAPSFGQLLLSCGQSLPADQLSEVITELTGHQSGTRPHTHLSTVLQQYADQLPPKAPRHPVILILDSLVQHLPWESVPVLRGHPVCRFPSLHHLHSQLVAEKGRGLSALKDGVDPRSTFYILNPDDNLPSTQSYLQKLFEQQEGWTGLTGVPPTKDQFTAALTDHQLLLYCGHGAGSKYLSGFEIQFLQCRAVALLMGCSSGRLVVEGQLEPYGMMHNYFLAGCPCVVGNLWDVTDKDIDRLTETFLTTLLDPDQDKCLAGVMAKSREACRLPYLIGCAPVVYGLPVRFR